MTINNTKIKILDVSYEMFARLGYEQTSLSNIAKKLGVSKQALCYHFKSKEEIFEILYECIIEDIKANHYINNNISSRDECYSNILTLGYNMIDYYIENPEFPLIMMQYFLLGLRNETIANLTDKLMKQVKIYYKKIIGMCVKFDMIKSNQEDLYVHIFEMIDQSILERSIHLPKTTLYDIWKTFVDKMLNNN
ncbi:TetR/AcrR family transcriptional regulator [Clostridiaceae bacterium M8S5]|nr:TetR/AcrR family transcriptional regulator [Clostridiaceae bacterium M8S5]